MSATLPWPPALVGTPTVAVIERAIARHRLSHSLLLHGDDFDTLVLVAHAIADRLLSPSAPGPSTTAVAAASLLTTSEASPATEPHHFLPEQHPDCYALR